MGLADVFGKEDRVEVAMSTLYGILKAGAMNELLMNAVNCDVPHRYIREMATGIKETEVEECSEETPETEERPEEVSG